MKRRSNSKARAKRPAARGAGGLPAGGICEAAKSEIDQAVARWVRWLDVEHAGRDRFVGGSEFAAGGMRSEGRVFGGLILAQAASAAGRTVGSGALHSLHAQFLRPAKAGVQIEYSVERVRDGRTFTARRVLACQAEETICDVTASFARPEDGITHQEPMPEVPDPEDCGRSPGASAWLLQDVPEQFRDVLGLDKEGKELAPGIGALEWRLARPPGDTPAPGKPLVLSHWMRVRSPLPDDLAVHSAAFVCISDNNSQAVIAVRHGRGTYVITSLNYAFWLHRPTSWDGWFLMVSESPSAHAGRALLWRRIYARDGTQVASIAQELLFRPRR